MKNTILVIDDSESIRELVSLCLKNADYRVVLGINGEDGIQKLKEFDNISLVISDLNMPVMDGITFLKEVRKEEKYKYLPIIILTTESQEIKKQEAKNNGATGWIIKPFAQEKLIAVVKKIIG